ncbi:MAG TPA: ATPase [Pseudomonas sp.]|jgi:DNA repair exonuclease SbcCD ATPase subunit|nr:ATPase [Pseudomonas sp.]
MRNDSFDEIDDLPSLTVEPLDRDAPPPARTETRSAVSVPVRNPVNGLLWALLLAALIALGALAWWSYNQLTLMSQQLVATQESFARISEEAAGRIQDITGKVVATESSISAGTESLQRQLRQLEGKLETLGRQIRVQEAKQDKRLDALEGEQKAQAGTQGKFDERLKAQAGELASLKGTAEQIGKLRTEQGKQIEALLALDKVLKTLTADVQTLKKANLVQAVKRVEQDLLALRSEVAGLPAGTGTTEFDTFRAQVTRNITTLQTQIQTLQRQIDGR